MKKTAKPTTRRQPRHPTARPLHMSLLCVGIFGSFLSGCSASQSRLPATDATGLSSRIVTVGWRQYVNRAYRYSFWYPAKATLDSASVDRVKILFSSLAPAESGGGSVAMTFSVQFDVTPNPLRLDNHGWMRQQKTSERDNNTHARSSILWSGWPAIRMVVNGADEQHEYTFAAVDTLFYQISFETIRPERQAALDELLPIFREIRDSFRLARR